MKVIRVLVMLMLLTAVFLVACGGEEEPTPVPPTDVPPTAIPTDVPPTDVPPTEVPTEVPPTEVPPTATPEPEPEPATATVTPILDAINVGDLAYGEAVAGLVTEESTMSWGFDGTAGSALNLTVTPLDDELDVIVDVVNADGMSILPFGEVDDAFGEEIVAFDIPADGTYLVTLHGFAGSGGTYNLILTEGGAIVAPPVSDAAVLYTETVSGIVPENETITHEFEGVAGGVINVIVTPTDDDLDAVIDIWDADGNSIIGGEVDEEFDVETLNGIVLPTDGTYQVAVRGFAGGGGAYDLTYTEVDGSGAAPMQTGDGDSAIGYGAFVTGEITSADGNTWTFFGSEGEFVDVTIEPYGDFDIVVDVVDSAGNSILFDGAVDSSYDTEFVRVVPIMADGQYAVVVTPFSDTEVGTYDLVLAETLGGSAGSVLFVYDEFTDPEEEGYVYPFIAAADEYVTLYVVPESLDLDVVVGVYNEETDELIEEVDYSTGREELIFYSENLDNYYFLVNSYEGTIGGYDLTLSGSENMIPETFVQDAIVGRFVDGEQLIYGYYGEAGTTVTFIIESDDNMDMVISLEDMDENILVAMDDEVSGDGEILTYTFEESLYIFVNVSEFYGDAGQFALYIE